MRTKLICGNWKLHKTVAESIELATAIKNAVKAKYDNDAWLSVAEPLKDGLRENPAYIAFALEDGVVYHTYTVSAPDPFVAPFTSFLLERTPKDESSPFLTYRKDEYPD